MSQWVLAVLIALGQFSQSHTGELRLAVTDQGGLPLPGRVEITSESSQLRLELETDAGGRVSARRLPFGRYLVSAVRDGFAPATVLIEIASALPAAHTLVLGVAPVRSDVTVTAADTLLDSRRAASSHHVGAAALAQRTTPMAGRALPDVVNAQPGWLLEANGILHPRGSEYQTQYVLDGLPLTDNRSPAFAPEVGASEVHAMTILTGGFPAEYGRKLGGVIEVVTTPRGERGVRGSAAVSAASFETLSADVTGGVGLERTAISLSAATASTGRYLDPPVEENFTNRGVTSQGALHVERDLSAADRFGLILRRGQSHFLVPNEHVQEEAGQRQDRRSAETAAQFSYQRLLSGSAVGDLRGMARDVSAQLWSNPASTPIVAGQDRGFRELYVKGTITASAGVHEIKAGADLIAGRVRERFGYRITDPGRFESGTPPAFAFDGRRADREQSAFVQDRIRAGAWTIYGGLRWDRYRLLVEDTAFSPRLAVAWSRPESGLVLRGAYDRVFQTPAVENLLLASSEEVAALGEQVLRLPVPPSRGRFYELGLSARLPGPGRLDVTWFNRRMHDVADDDLLLNTGVGFPIAFSRADIDGAEVKLDVPAWRGWSASLAYSHLRGTGMLPITGGLFLGDEEIARLDSRERFPLTQDQRHTVRGRVGYAHASGRWAAAALSYGSGLPFEDFDDDPAEAAAQFGPRVVGRVDFETGRVRPNFSADLSAGTVLAGGPRGRLRLQAEIRNLTNRLDVINFAGLFSGTALASPRSLAVRLRADF